MKMKFLQLRPSKNGFMLFAIMLFLVAIWPVELNAQEDVQLRLVAVDTTSFPAVYVTLLTADPQSAPADLSNLSLRENGTPVTDLTFANVPSGVDVTFVLDANLGFNEIDDDTGLKRREKVRDSIHRFATQYMNADGLDSVSIVVPAEDGQGAQFLLQDATAVRDVTTAIDAYDPPRLGPTPLNEMLSLALEHAQNRRDNGRYQAVLLFTDGRRLDQQLSFPLLTAQANDAGAPIYTAILGESADPNEIANASRLTEPTRAFYLHMPEPQATDPIYQIWQQQSNPVQVQYRSRQRQSGRNQLTINLGLALISTSFEIVLAAPEIELSIDEAQIRRAGIAPDTPLASLQPVAQPLTIAIEWPDGIPRQLDDVTLLVDGNPQSFTEDWQVNPMGHIDLTWDISRLQAGDMELVVQVTDELGYQGSSRPVLVEVKIDRPLPPTPVPTTEPEKPSPQPIPTSGLRWELIVGFILLLVLVFSLLFWRRRRAAAKNAENADKRLGVSAAGEGAGGSTGESMMIAALEPLNDQAHELIALDGENITIGSEVQSVQLLLLDESVGRLHARIRRQGHNNYWLFDEGSADGTYLNYERLGLAPRELTDGDTLQFGKVAFRFRLRPSAELEE
jgi:hypothetical protein